MATTAEELTATASGVTVSVWFCVWFKGSKLEWRCSSPFRAGVSPDANIACAMPVCALHGSHPCCLYLIGLSSKRRSRVFPPRISSVAYFRISPRQAFPVPSPRPHDVRTDPLVHIGSNKWGFDASESVFMRLGRSERRSHNNIIMFLSALMHS